MLDFNIIPHLISAIKYGGVVIGLGLTKLMSDTSEIMSDPTAVIAKAWDGFKSVSPNNLAMIMCSFLFPHTASILLVLQSLVVPIVIMSVIYVLLCSIYMACLFYQSKFEAGFDFKSDEAGLIMLKIGLYFAELCLASILLACVISAVGSIMLVTTSFSVAFIANIAYISVFSAAMLANYCTTPEDPDDAKMLLYDFMPAAAVEYAKSLGYRLFYPEEKASITEEDIMEKLRL